MFGINRVVFGTLRQYNSQPLSGDLAGVYKFRIGDYRVIYMIEDESISIQAVGHRRDIYKR